VLVIGVAGFVVAIRTVPRRWMLLAAYFSISFAIATVADLQVGGSHNYFFESLFAITPFAVWLAVRICKTSNVFGAVTSIIALVLAVALVLGARLLPDAYSSFMEVSQVERKNCELQKIARPLQGHRVLSFVPSITAMLEEKVITEPYLLSYLHSTHRYDLGPLVARIHAQEFGAVVVNSEAQWWRHVPHIPDPLYRAIPESYQPTCILRQWMIWVPLRPKVGDTLYHELQVIGCKPCGTGANCTHW
jgi:hypothetical protein